VTVVYFGANDVCEKLTYGCDETFLVFDAFKKGKFNGVEIQSPSRTDLILNSNKIVICTQGTFDDIVLFLNMIGVDKKVIYCANTDGSIIHLNEFLKFRNQGILLVTMPKSGTVWITNALKIAAKRKTIYSVPRLVNRQNSFDIRDIDEVDLSNICENGEIISLHLFCTTHSLKILRNAVLTNGLKLIVNWRDPRQALLSWVHHVDRIQKEFQYELSYLGYPSDYNVYTLEEKISCNIDKMFGSYVEWVRSWKAVYDSDYANSCLFISQELLATNPLKYKSLVGQFLGTTSIPLDDKPITNQYHFRKGSTDEWKTVYTAKQIDRVNSMLNEGGVLKFVEEYFSQP